MNKVTYEDLVYQIVDAFALDDKEKDMLYIGFILGILSQDNKKLESYLKFLKKVSIKEI